jgi:hypothetical protein
MPARRTIRVRNPESTMLERYRVLLGSLHIALGACTLLAAFIVFVVVVGGGIISGDATAIVITGRVGACVALLLAVLSLPALVSGVGILTRQPWSCVAAVIVGVLSLCAVPAGTVIGILTLWVYWKHHEEEHAGETPAVG